MLIPDKKIKKSENAVLKPNVVSQTCTLKVHQCIGQFEQNVTLEIPTLWKPWYLQVL